MGFLLKTSKDSLKLLINVRIIEIKINDKEIAFEFVKQWRKKIALKTDDMAIIEYS